MPRPATSMTEMSQSVTELTQLLTQLLKRADKQGFILAEAEISIFGTAQKVVLKVFLPPK